MPLRCYVVPVPAQTTAPTLRIAVEGDGGPNGIPTHDLPNASAALFRLSHRTVGASKPSFPRGRNVAPSLLHSTLSEISRPQSVRTRPKEKAPEWPKETLPTNRHGSAS